MKTADHCAESVKLFGEEYREVHLWLDEFFSTPLGARHRRKRHHLKGVDPCRDRPSVVVGGYEGNGATEGPLARPL